LPDILLTELLSYKSTNPNRYPKFEETFNDKFNHLFEDDPRWIDYTLIGTTILDEKNVSKGNTNTWIKFWAPAFKAAQTGKPGAYFKQCTLPEDDDNFKYVYINLRKDHPEYGYMVVCYQSRIANNDNDNDNNESTVVKTITTGKEQFHPVNNKIV
jgi:hypothetical protein